MDEFVRIRTESGAEVTISAAYAESLPGVEVLDAPATNVRGRPLPMSRRDGRPVKPRTTVKKAAAKKAATSKAAASAAADDSPKEATR